MYSMRLHIRTATELHAGTRPVHNEGANSFFVFRILRVRIYSDWFTLLVIHGAPIMERFRMAPGRLAYAIAPHPFLYGRWALVRYSPR